MGASGDITFKKIVVTKLTQNFREATEIQTATIGSPASDEIIIKNRFVGINASDINFTAGRYFNDAKVPLDAGFEGVGEVVAIGDEVTNIKVGQSVAYMSNGAFAEYLKLSAKLAIPLPLPKPQPEVVAMLASAMTAVLALDKVGEMKSGEKVLVTGAAGGTGQFAVQWAKNAGCHVIGTCSTDEKVELLKSLGCDRPINVNKEELKEVLEKEYASGVDVVYECIGGPVFDASVEGLAQKGRLLIIGFISGYKNDSGRPEFEASALPAKLIFKSASVRGFLLPHFREFLPEYFGKVLQAYLKGTMKITVDNGVNDPKGPFKGLESVADAVDYLYSRKSRGKIVVELNSANSTHL